LPGEDVEMFGRGFDRLVALGPAEIQVGILKRLRGTPIVRHDAEFGMVYSPTAPYEVLQTGCIDFTTMQRMRRFARFWDLIANSGQFVETTPLIWGEGSPFEHSMRLSDWLYARLGRQHGVALERLAELLLEFLVDQMKRDGGEVGTTLWRDLSRGARRDVPEFLRRFVPQDQWRRQRRGEPAAIPPRQARRLAGR